jgi:hypothetical protein|tara:strand:- start:30 stop:449 length:420 start_codon:yes stop_codon:yes gene_type:complete
LSNTSWILSLSYEEYLLSNKSKKGTQRFNKSDQRKINRMVSRDKLIYFIIDKNRFTGISELLSNDYDVLDNKTISVKVKKYITLPIKNSVDGDQVGPRLEYVKRWVPERWRLAMVGSLHIIQQNDYKLIEACLKAHEVS